MAKQVRDTAAGQSISAYVVLNKKGEHVATVNTHFSNGGTVTADVWNHGKSAQRCLGAALACGHLSADDYAKAVAASRDSRDWCRNGEYEDFVADDLFGLQQGRAGGYGYDKTAAALAGLWIDGEQLADHCGVVTNVEKAKDAIQKAYNKECDGEWVNRSTPKSWADKAAKIGAHFANWETDSARFLSLHFVAGLLRLEVLGYTVIQAI